MAVPIPQGATLQPLDNSQGGSVPIPQGATLQPITQSDQQPDDSWFHGFGNATQQQIDQMRQQDSPLHQLGQGVAGFAKSAGQTLKSVVELPDIIAGTRKPDAIDKALTLTNDDQRGGAMMENIIEFALGDEALKGLSLADRLAQGSKLASVLEKYPRLASILSNAIRTGTVGTAQGVAHGETPGEAVKQGAITGATGGAIDAAAEGAGALANQLKESAVRQYSKVLAPTTKENKAITEKVVPELIERGTRALTRKGLEEQVAANAEKAGAAVDAAIDRRVAEGSYPRPGQKALPEAKPEIVTGVQQVRPSNSPGALIDAESRPIVRQGEAVPNSTPEEINARIASNQARAQVGTQASAVPERVFGPDNRIADTVGTQANAVPQSTFAGKTENGVQYLSGSAHPEMSGELTNPASFQSSDRVANQRTLSALQKIAANPEHFGSFSPAEQDAILNQIGRLKELTQTGKAVEAGPIMSTKPILDHLESLKNDFTVNGAAVDQDALNRISKLQGIVAGVGDNVSLESMRRLRQILDNKVAYGKGFFGKTLAEGSELDLQKNAADAIRAEFGKQFPDIQRVNQEYSFWKNVNDVLEATKQRKVGQEGGLWRTGATLLAGAAGLTHGIGAGAADAGLGFALNETVKSPAWRTTSAVLKSRLADALVSGTTRQVYSLLRQISPAAVNTAVQQWMLQRKGNDQ